MKKNFRFKPCSHKKGSSTKIGNPKYTRKIPLNDFHSLKKKSQEEIRPLHSDHWQMVARLKHDGIGAKKARTSGSWNHLKFAVRLTVV
jgi:hypothetical protein